MGLNKEGCVVLPKSIEFTDAVPEIIENNDSKDVIGKIQYTYADRIVGGTDIEVTGAKVTEFSFKEKKEEMKEDVVEEKIVTIDIKYIILGIIGIILLIGVGFGIYHFVDNFYLIKYKLSCRRKRRLDFKDIKIKDKRKKKW